MTLTLDNFKASFLRYQRELDVDPEKILRVCPLDQRVLNKLHTWCETKTPNIFHQSLRDCKTDRCVVMLCRKNAETHKQVISRSLRSVPSCLEELIFFCEYSRLPISQVLENWHVVNLRLAPYFPVYDKWDQWLRWQSTHGGTFKKAQAALLEWEQRLSNRIELHSAELKKKAQVPSLVRFSGLWNPNNDNTWCLSVTVKDAAFSVWNSLVSHKKEDKSLSWADYLVQVYGCVSPQDDFLLHCTSLQTHVFNKAQLKSLCYNTWMMPIAQCLKRKQLQVLRVNADEIILKLEAKHSDHREWNHLISSIRQICREHGVPHLVLAPYKIRYLNPHVEAVALEPADMKKEDAKVRFLFGKKLCYSKHILQAIQALQQNLCDAVDLAFIDNGRMAHYAKSMFVK